MGALVAVDWGTSSLRGALLDAQGHVAAERSFPHGILSVEPGRFGGVFDACFGDWMGTARMALISGMAGSRQGWVEAPYCACPAGLDEIASAVTWVEPGRIAIVPGLSHERSGTPDVLRGEETQVMGALALRSLSDATLVLPGTHSKWVRARGGSIQAFTTFMTGEVFALLRHQSILARGMPAGEDALDESAFLQGVRFSRASRGLLEAAFSARTLSLFGKLPAAALPSYLSGLVIGEELREAGIGDGDGDGELIVVAGDALSRRYDLALADCGASSRSRVGAEAAWRGLHVLSQRLGTSST